MAKYDYRGIVHCHSTHSDGTGTIEEIMAAANDVGLDFVLLTDHDKLKAASEERWHESALLICGAEIAPPEGNHYIVFGEGKFKGIDKLNAKKPQEIIDAVNEQKWAGFIAHPDHMGAKRLDIPARKWDAWDVDGYTGMGLWDLMTDWQSQFDREEAKLEVYNEFERWLSGPRLETLKRWDELNAKRKVVGIGEVNNHRYRKELDGKTLEIFPYDVAFRTVTNHVLLDRPLDKDYAKARKQIIDGIRHGAFYVSFDFWDDPTEFSFEIDNGESVAGMGDTIELGEEKTELVAAFPEEGLLNVYHNGTSILEEQGDEILIEITEPGVYRVEAMRNDIVWVLSNPVFVTPKKEA
jgi:hypothetical protein